MHLEHLKSVTTLRSVKEIEKNDFSNPTHIETQKPFEVNFEILEPSNSEPENCVWWEEKRINALLDTNTISLENSITKKGNIKYGNL